MARDPQAPDPGAAGDEYAEEKARLTPEDGFELVGIDFFAPPGDRLYPIRHFAAYRDALAAKKGRGNPEEYFVLYRDAGGECRCR